MPQSRPSPILPVQWQRTRSTVAEPHRYISIRGAREHNLKNVDLDLPRDRLVVITGLSGSGKSSLAFDTVYAEGQRRYVESLSAYARQFLELMQKPDVDFDRGPLARHLDRAEDDVAQPALDGRHGHRDLRLPAPAVRPRRRALLARHRPADREPDRVADGRSHQDDGRRHAALPDGADRARPQGRVPQGTAGAAEEGFPAGQDRRQALRDRRGAGARQEIQARHRRGGGPHRGAARPRQPPGRFDRNGAHPGRGPRRRGKCRFRASARSSRRASPVPSRASASRRSSPGCSPSTPRRAPARPATASA